MAEWARKDNRQLVEVELLYAPGGGFRDEPIRKWVRADEPDFFAEYVNVEKLVTTIIEIAEGEADAKPAGKHRFVVRTKQHLGERSHISFPLAPSYIGSGDEVALVPSGGVRGGGGGGDIAAAQILASNNGQLMRINAQMFDAALRPLAQQNTQLLTELISLREENSQLQRRLSDAESNRMDREFQIAMAAEKNNRTNAGFQKLLQLGSVVAAKMVTGNDAAAQLGEATPLAMLIGDFYQSLRPEQINTLMQTLEMAQKIMFMEIVNLVRPPDQGQPQGQPPPGPGLGGINGARP